MQYVEGCLPKRNLWRWRIFVLFAKSTMASSLNYHYRGNSSSLQKFQALPYTLITLHFPHKLTSIYSENLGFLVGMMTKVATIWDSDGRWKNADLWGKRVLSNLLLKSKTCSMQDDTWITKIERKKEGKWKVKGY